MRVTIRLICRVCRTPYSPNQDPVLTLREPAKCTGILAETRLSPILVSAITITVQYRHLSVSLVSCSLPAMHLPQAAAIRHFHACANNNCIDHTGCSCYSCGWRTVSASRRMESSSLDGDDDEHCTGWHYRKAPARRDDCPAVDDLRPIYVGRLLWCSSRSSSMSRLHHQQS